MFSVAEKQCVNDQIDLTQLTAIDTGFNRETTKEFARINNKPANSNRKTQSDNRIITKPPEQVLQSFNTWAFKREQPDTPELLLAQLKAAMTTMRPIRFLMYWGKGPRHAVGEPEETCLDFLASMTKRIAATYAPGAEFMLICTDTHAGLNGHASSNIDAYFAGVTEVAAKRGFSTCRLSHLLDQHDPQALLTFDGELRADPIFEKLVKSASKWYSGSDNIEEGAEDYYRMNLREKQVVEMAFPDSIFASFNGHEFRNLFPESLPIFYMYATKRGCSVKPWFVSSTLAPEVQPSETFA